MNLANLPPLGLKTREPKKDPKHLARVAELPCCICEAFGLVQIGRTYVHHTICQRYSQEKVPDRETIPLCYLHHQGELGVHTNKTAWQQEYGSDRDYIAATLDKLGV
jgi:hypothetical protein